MPVPCMILITGLLCLDAHTSSGSVTVEQHNSPAGRSYVIEGPGFHAEATSRDAKPESFGHAEANYICVYSECVYYRRQCVKNGEETKCSFEVDAKYPSYRHMDIQLKADNDAGLQFAMSHAAIASYLGGGSQSAFPLSALDGTSNGTLPSEK